MANRRAFVYSLGLSALFLSVAAALLLFSAVPADSGRYDFSEFSATASRQSEISIGLSGALLESGRLALVAASDYAASSNSSFSNASCVLSALALHGNVTSAQCAGESFGYLEVSNQSYSLSRWADSSASLYSRGAISASASVVSVEAHEESGRAVFSAVASSNVSSATGSSLNKTLVAHASLDISGLAANPFN